MNEFYFDESVENFHFRITHDGKLLVRHYKTPEYVERDWYKAEKTGKPWFPKRRNVISLLKQSIREGDYDDLKPRKS